MVVLLLGGLSLVSYIAFPELVNVIEKILSGGSG